MKKTFSTLLFFTVVIYSLNAQTISEKINSILNDYNEKGLFNGSALVSKNGEIIYKEGFGYANFEWNTENNTDTKFKIGSCTKQFTAALIMILHEKGMLKLNNTISDFIPEYPSEKGAKITIHHLLSHTSGIPEYFSIPEMQNLIYKNNIPSEFITNFWNLDLLFEPGTKLKYSNSGYFVLGKIIENITGKTYAEALQDEIFKPLEMRNTGVIDDNEVLNNKAYGYIKKDSSLKTAPYYNATGVYSAGAIYSTVEDLFKWQQSLQSNSILTEKSLNKMLEPNFSRYGYGFGILKVSANQNKTITLFGHEGEFFGFRSLIHIIQEDNISIILLDNNQNTSLMKSATEVRKILYAN
jgi:CubicO group peptidase (beta-lactamase class C family)